jgi:5-methylcytosine-specific restriction endonuclease McrA
MKRCPGCDATFPASTAYFNRNAARRDGLEHYCRTCSRARKRAYMAQYGPAHCDAKRHYDAAYRERLADTLRAKKAAYYEANKEQIISKSHAYYEANKDRILGQYRDPDHRARILANQHRRRARQLSGGDHTAADVHAQYARQRGRCYWCHERVGDHYHVDHVTPLALGGTNGPENLVIACAPCNRRKHARHPMDFAGVLC